jgi:hypothetical protein
MSVDANHRRRLDEDMKGPAREADFTGMDVGLFRAVACAKFECVKFEFDSHIQVVWFTDTLSGIHLSVLPRYFIF